MYSLGYIEPFNSWIHGNNNTNLNTHYYVNLTEPLENLYNIEYHPLNIQYIRQYYIERDNLIINISENNIQFKHPIILNYDHIIKNDKTYNVKLLKIYEIDDVMLAVDTTYLLRILQRKFKKIYKHKKQILDYRKNPKELLFRQIHGRWSNRCMF